MQNYTKHALHGTDKTQDTEITLIFTKRLHCKIVTNCPDLKLLLSQKSFWEVKNKQSFGKRSEWQNEGMIQKGVSFGSRIDRNK